MTTVDFLDALKARYNLRSDYAVAKLLGISCQRTSMYYSGTRRFNPEMSIQVAELLGLDPISVLASVELERETRPAVRQLWERFAAGFAFAVLAAGLAGAPSPAPAAEVPLQLCIMSNRRYRRAVHSGSSWDELQRRVLEFLLGSPYTES